MKMFLAAALVAGVFSVGVGPSKGAVGGGLDMPGAPRPATANVTYHGGWVMRTNTTYTIFWLPAGSTCGESDPTCDTYISGVDRYFKDVAAASGSDSNVYSVDTEYSDTTGPIAYQSTFGGAFIDEHAFPAYDPNTSCTDGTYPICLTDQQIQAEVQRVVTQLGWPDGESVLFNLMTPDSVSECDDHTSTFCLGSFCAYHGAFTGSDSQPIVYTLEPFAETDGCAGIPLNPSPNGDDADPTDNLISHEMNEAITDPWGTGWYTGATTAHGEIADLCAWNFGNPLGTAPNGQAYNEVINGHDYYLQQEWSNDGSQCLQRYVPGVSLPASLTAPVVTGAAGLGRLLSTTNGTWSGTPTSYLYRWQRCSPGNVNSCTDIAGATAATYQLAVADVGFVVRSEVSALNAAGASDPRPSSASDVVVSIPTAISAPVVTGAGAVGQLLTTSSGSWTETPTSYSYRWQRCVSAVDCTDIAGATDATYKLVAADAGVVVRSEVTASNAAGASAPAVSAKSDVVVAAPVATTAPVLSGLAAVGGALITTHGAWNPAGSTFAYQWLRCGADGSGCVPIPGATDTAYALLPADAGHTLEARVSATDLAGTTAALSNRSDVVIDRPAVTSAPHISGHARVGKKLRGSPGAWTNTPTGYGYQWLRCNKHGRSCKRIRRATHSTYRITRRDVGHRIRLRVTALNDAGSVTATSRPTARVGRTR
jgi:hypothetical protein